MPTDIRPALKRRKAERKSERAKVVYVPLVLCGFTVALSIASPAFSAAMTLLALS